METARDDDTPILLFTARNPTRVLVIDPQDDARTQLVASLRQTGAEVVSLATPAGATASILSHRIDVLILDASVDGFVDRFVAVLRQNPLLDQVAILVTINGLAGGFDEVVQSMGADGFVSKTANAAQLAPVLRSARAHARKRARGR